MLLLTLLKLFFDRNKVNILETFAFLISLSIDVVLVWQGGDWNTDYVCMFRIIFVVVMK